MNALRQFLAGFEAAAQWASGIEDSEHEFADSLELARGERVRLLLPAARWFRENREALDRGATLLEGTSPDGSTGYELAGHNAWLSAAGHGTGFWDRSALEGCWRCGRQTKLGSVCPSGECGGLESVGDRLDRLAKNGLGWAEWCYFWEDGGLARLDK